MSVITLISLIGVSLGVMVLVVVMSVMAGFESMVKDRVLGESPHITLLRTESWNTPNADGEVLSAEAQWRALQEKAEELPSVLGAYPLVRDFVIVDMFGSIVPVLMRGIDTEDPDTIAGLKELEIAGDVAIGMGYVANRDDVNATSEVAVVSSIFAEENQLRVGDVLEVVSNRNMKQLKPLLDRKGSVTVFENHRESFNNIKAQIESVWLDYEDREKMLFMEVQVLREFLNRVLAENIRSKERKSLEVLVDLTMSEEFDDDYNYYEVGQRQKFVDEIMALSEMKAEDLDREEELQLNELALPKSVRIQGIYRADRFAPGSPLLVPLHLAQELAGVGTTGAVNGVALRLKDPYQAVSVIENEVISLVADGWTPVTWMEQYEQQFALISMQKLMMTLALSFIVLIAVFSIGAVMFTVTIQKKREIGVMKALGATPQQVTNVFALQGVIVGVFGAILGLSLSLLVLVNLSAIQGALRNIGFDPFSHSFYGMDTLPYELNYSEMVIVCVSAFVLCSIAAYLPAWKAAKADAARSLRNL